MSFWEIFTLAASNITIFGVIVGIFSVYNGRATRREISGLIKEIKELIKEMQKENRDLIKETQNLIRQGNEDTQKLIKTIGDEYGHKEAR